MNLATYDLNYFSSSKFTYLVSDVTEMSADGQYMIKWRFGHICIPLNNFQLWALARRRRGRMRSAEADGVCFDCDWIYGNYYDRLSTINHYGKYT